MYIFNWTIFIAIMYSLIRKARSKLAWKKRREITVELKQQLRVAMMISILFGLGWGFALLASSNLPVTAIRVVFNSLFTILVAFQGFFIFLIYVVFSPNAKKEWKKWILRKEDKGKKPFISGKGYVDSSTGTGTAYANKSKAYSYGFAPTLDTSTTIVNEAVMEELTLKLQSDDNQLEQVCTNPLDLGDLVSLKEDDDTQSLLVEETTLCPADTLSNEYPHEDSTDELVKGASEQEALSEIAPDETSVSDRHSSSANEENRLICDIEIHPLPERMRGSSIDTTQSNLSEELMQASAGEEAALVSQHRDTS